MARTSYTHLTLAACKKLGRICAIAEKWNAFAGPIGRDGKRVGIRQDLFDFIDIVALAPGSLIGIQSTGPSGHAEHLRKILACPSAEAWLHAGGRIELWSWRKLLVKRGGKARTWEPRVQQIGLEDFAGGPGLGDQARTGVPVGSGPESPALEPFELGGQ